MLKSMTGFGKDEAVLPDKKVMIEIRSLNSKNTDISVKAPPMFRDREMVIRQMISDRLVRGKIDVNIYIEMNEGVTTTVINKEVFKNYYREILEITEELPLEGTEGIIQAIMRLPDTISTAKAEPDEKEWESVEQTIGNALDQLDEFRIQEGRSLFNDLKERAASILSLLKEVEPYEEERVNRIRERILRNLNGLSEDIDQNRFEQELIYYIERLDISEEKTRLQNHCDYFTQTMTGSESSGKKLAFISQEMGREINTLGSKANDPDIQRLVVMMKDELEKIKEQIANIL